MKHVRVALRGSATSANASRQMSARDASAGGVSLPASSHDSNPAPVASSCVNARQHLRHLPQPVLAVARHQEHAPRHARHEQGRAAGRHVAGGRDQARRWHVAPLERGEDRGLRRDRAQDPVLMFVVGRPRAQHVAAPAAVPHDGQFVHQRREPAGEPACRDNARASAQGLLNPRQ